MMSQFKKMQTSLSNTGAIKWKHAMHLIRLLLSGITILEQGVVPVQVEAMREQLLAIKRGELTFAEVNAWRLRLHREFDAAYVRSTLPDRADVEVADAFLIKARRSMVDAD